MQQSAAQLVIYARQIAVYGGYTNLVNGLQPLEILYGEEGKYQHEIAELKEALQQKTWLHVLHEVCDVLYYAACCTEQGMDGLYENALHECVTLLWSYNIRLSPEQLESAALAKYVYRASAPRMKDEKHELALIQETIASLQRK